MPPGKQPMKVDELFPRCLRHPETPCTLQDGLRCILDVTPDPTTSDTARQLPLSAPAYNRPVPGPQRTKRPRADAVTFDDVHVNFTGEEWNLLSPSQKSLYKDVMLETYWNLTAIGYNWEDHHIEEKCQSSRSHERTSTMWKIL